MNFIILFINIITLLSFTLVLSDGCGAPESNKNQEELTYSAKCNNLAQYLVHENQLDDLIDLLSYKRELVLTQDSNGWTPLHEAARIGNPLMIYFLIVNGVDVLAKTKQSHTALEILKTSRPKESAGDDNRVVKSFQLSQAILEKAEMGKGLTGHVIDTNAIKTSKEVIFDMPGLANALVFYGLKHELQELHFLNPDAIDESDDNGWTPLHEAARNGNIKILEFLINQGADIFKMTSDGETALGIAKIFTKNSDRETHDKVMNILNSNIKEFKTQYNSYLRK